ncbi:MAG: hypothetical protein U1E91_02325 [Moraxella sp.]
MDGQMVTEGSAADGLPAGEFNTAFLMAIKFFELVGGVMDIGFGVPLNQLQQQDGAGQPSMHSPPIMQPNLTKNSP